MKRNLLVAFAIALASLAVPSAALAHHGRHHHRHHHKLGLQRVRVVHIGTDSSSGSAPSDPGSTPPTTENAGTVASYTEGVLTLSLKDGSSLSGKVTNATRIRCLSATPAPPSGEGEDRGQGDDDKEQGTANPSDKEWGADDQSGDSKDSWEHEDGRGDHEDSSEPPCDSSALVAGAVVRAAELRIGPSGSEFESVWLVR